MKPWRALAALAFALICVPPVAADGPSSASWRMAAFPLRIADHRRNLVDSEGRAFLLNGDTAWSLIAELSREDAVRYLEDRRRRGFNAILVNLVESRFATRAPANHYGEPPFTRAGDFSTPNERYFAHADYVIAQAAERGFLVLLTPAYLGFGGGDQGWYREMVINGRERLRGYGRYLGQRYRRFANILWVHGGDFNPSDKSVSREVALGIRELDTRSLHTAHGAPETSALDYWSGEDWLSIDSIYTRRPVFSVALETYGRSRLPFFLIEGRYENEGGPEGTAQRARAQAYHALLSGAMGHVFGNNPVWHFSGPGLYETSSNWQEALDSPGAQSMRHLRALFAAHRWWMLTPDFANSLLTDGLGDGHDRAVAAHADDRSFAVAYLPTARSVRVNLAQLAGPRIDARWMDPSDGAYTVVPGSPFSASGVRAFEPSRANASGAGDWVLVLESRAQ
jgi:hypothetical protein